MKFSIRTLFVYTALVAIIVAGFAASPAYQNYLLLLLKLAIFAAVLYLATLRDGKIRIIAKSALLVLTTFECASTLLLIASSIATARAERLDQLDADTWWQQQNLDGFWTLFTYISWFAALIVACGRAAMKDA